MRKDCLEFSPLPKFAIPGISSITLFAACFGIVSCSSACSLKPDNRPNIIFILADDLGPADVGCYGSEDIITPHINSLAANGVLFSAGYVTAPICGPSRAGLLSGRYQTRFGFETNPTPEFKAWDMDLGFPTDIPMLQEVLKSAGYRTGMVGKWHMGVRPRFHPLKRGFDEFLGFTGGMKSYFQEHERWYDHGNFIQRNGIPLDSYRYLTTEFTEAACAFIRESVGREEPFYLYLSHLAPHTPLQATQEDLARCEHIEERERRIFAAMMCALDDGVGRVIEELREGRVLDNTLIVFLGDNGSNVRPQAGGSSGKLHGGKGSIEEGGVRVPFLMQWPDHFPDGLVFGSPVIALDLFPTFAALAGVKAPDDLDGVNLTPYILGEKSGIPHQTLYWRQITKSGLRHGDWKLIRNDDKPTALYNLNDDPYERENLINELPEKLGELETLYRKWDSGNIPSIIPVPRREDYEEANRLFSAGIDYKVVPPEERIMKN